MSFLFPCACTHGGVGDDESSISSEDIYMTYLFLVGCERRLSIIHHFSSHPPRPLVPLSTLKSASITTLYYAPPKPVKHQHSYQEVGDFIVLFSFFLCNFFFPIFSCISGVQVL